MGRTTLKIKSQGSAKLEDKVGFVLADLGDINRVVLLRIAMETKYNKMVFQMLDSDDGLRYLAIKDSHSEDPKAEPTLIAFPDLAEYEIFAVSFDRYLMQICLTKGY